MAYEGVTEITFMESVQSRRVVYLSCYSASRATVPVTLAQDLQPKLYVGGGLNLSTTSTLRAADATNGLYFVVLTQSECSAVGLAGPATIRCSNTSVLETRVNINFTKLDSADSMRAGLFALPNAAAAAAGGLLTLGTGTGQITPSGGSVGIVPGTLSGVSVEVKTSGIVVGSIAKGNYSGVSQEILTGGIQTTSIGAGSYSGVSVEVKTGGIQTTSIGKGAYSGVSVEVTTGGIQTASIGKGAYSGVSLEITTGGIQTTSVGAGTYSSVTVQGLSNYANISNVTLAAGTHSNVTIQGVTRVNSGVTLNADVHSGASVEIKTGGIQTTSVGKGSYSGVTVGIDNIKGATYSDVTVQGVTRTLNLSTNGDKTGYSISGTKTTLDALNDITGSAVTLHAGTHSDATIQGISNWANLPTLVDLTASSITSMAKAVVTRNIDNSGFDGRTVGSALATLRNKVVIDANAGTVTVYDTDDTTTLWTGVVTSGTSPIASVDPS